MTTSPTTSLLRRAVALMGVGALVLSACGEDDDTASPTTASPTTTATAAPTTVPVAETDVLVYFFTADETVAAAGRTAPGDDLARGALEALLDGPAGIETELEMVTLVPDATEVLGVTVADGLATVDLTGAFESGGGSLSMMGRVAQVVFTLTALEDVDAVTVHLDGAAVEGIGGEGVPANDLTRAEFADLTPMILVEAPTPGAAVDMPFTVSGFANTFEGTVNYTIADNEGLILDEGFTTASLEEVGTWGPFSFTVDVTPSRSGLGEVIVYEISPEDGSQQHLVEIPVEMTAP